MLPAASMSPLPETTMASQPVGSSARMEKGPPTPSKIAATARALTYQSSTGRPRPPTGCHRRSAAVPRRSRPGSPRTRSHTGTCPCCGPCTSSLVRSIPARVARHCDRSLQPGVRHGARGRARTHRRRDGRRRVAGAAPTPQAVTQRGSIGRAFCGAEQRLRPSRVRAGRARPLRSGADGVAGPMRTGNEPGWRTRRPPRISVASASRMPSPRCRRWQLARWGCSGDR